MNEKRITLSVARLQRIREQGYVDQTDQELSDLAFGVRFAYRACTIILLIGVVTADIPLLITMNMVALLSVFLPNHLFDYIYNGIVAKMFSKPQLPARTPQLQFACSIATMWIMATVLLFHFEMIAAAYIMGAALLVVAGLVSTIDLCIPSIMYNKIYGFNMKTQKL